ncbi:Arylamine N-acetyltransferase [Paraburkholderia nemoris]|uniref:arylamine N-acetyltransferase family protein n=1 Tax=Paraburkholderia nemoris TaxID=2793076 RepID=UPI001B03E12B|nr:arylamine N-acetyltransferase [Paraburkholderia nemoris]CAE6952291.1 Arylamine N-acetyltransferase [Paraburkholderia nemoris]
MDQIDLRAYFDRIRYKNPGVPGATLETLEALHALHPQAIPFENLDALLGRQVRLDLHSIQQKLVAQGRGGYCFEHNLLFRSVLQTLGFKVGSFAGRVLWGRDAGLELPARAHMVLVVKLGEQRFLTDVGFGGLTMSAPLLLETGIEQRTPHGAYRILDSESEIETDGEGLPGFVLEAQIDSCWLPVYRFDLDPQYQDDYEMKNHFVATHPESLFVQNLLAARLAPGRRLGLFNRAFRIHDERRGTQKIELPTVGDVLRTLAEDFGIALPGSPGELEAALSKLPT